MRLYAIGDIHGHLDQLREAHRRIADDGGETSVVAHVGDLIDRGPDSAGVVDYLMRGRDAGRPWIVTRGNHDRFLPLFLDRPGWVDPNLASGQHWVDHYGLGAAATLRSYGVDPDQPRDALVQATRAAVPAAHLRYLAGLPLWYLHPLALVVHAGIRPGIGLQDQTEDDLVWIRQGFLDSDADFGPLVVHGHTALDRPTLYRNRLNIDGGAAYGRPLSTIVVEPGRVHLLTDAGRQPLFPE